MSIVNDCTKMVECALTAAVALVAIGIFSVLGIAFFTITALSGMSPLVAVIALTPLFLLGSIASIAACWQALMLPSRKAHRPASPMPERLSTNFRAPVIHSPRGNLAV
jgi:hypothetical protein